MFRPAAASGETWAEATFDHQDTGFAPRRGNAPRERAANHRDSRNQIEVINFGISMPITTRIAAEIVYYRDKWQVENENTFFTHALVEVLLIANCVTSVVEGVARAFFAVALLPMLFLGNFGSRFYQKTLVGLGVNLLTIPAAMGMIFNHLTSESLAMATVQSLADRLVGPWIDLVEPQARIGMNEGMSRMNRKPRTETEVAKAIATLDGMIAVFRGNYGIPEADLLGAFPS